MATVILRSGRKIGDFLVPYFIAELNTSHFGDLAVAQQMILKAKEVGCDCVKFQSWSPDTLYSEGYYRQNPIAARVVKKFALSEMQLAELADFSRDNGIDFASTPYSLREAEFLVSRCKVPFIKIASMELNNWPFLKDLASFGVPLVLSTGMGTLDEIKEAVSVISNEGRANIILLHCTSIYPAPPETIRLQNIIGLRSEFPDIPVGYSDHSEGYDITCASIALGACLIEKHFTLDRTKIGMDNQMATEPSDMRLLTSSCLRVHHALGGTGRLLSSREREMSIKMRRSMVAKIDLEAGTRLTKEAVEFKRPGSGIQPSQAEHFFGRVVSVKVKKGDTIFSSMFV